MSQLSISGLTVHYEGKHGPVVALDDFTLEVEQGGFGVLLGPSGCGKSTALNAVAGLLDPVEGRIALGDEVVFNSRKGSRAATPPNRRPIGMVFQSYALWPHLSVADNVAYPLKRQGMDKDQRRQRVHDMLSMVRCQNLAARYPGQLSGGQQQRIALARAIASRPKVLLFDEPLSNLDAGLRAQLRDELKQLHHDLQFTALYVTHDQSEALALGTHVTVMRQGVVVQEGGPREVYERPADDYAASFFGYNLLPGVVSSASFDAAGNRRVDTPFGSFSTRSEPGPSEDVVVAMHPNRISVQPRDGSQAGAPELTVELVTYVGAHTEVTIGAGGHSMTVVAPATVDYAEGDHVAITCEPEAVHAFLRPEGWDEGQFSAQDPSLMAPAVGQRG